MEATKRFQKVKIAVAIVYALIFLAYAFFVFGHLSPKEYNEDVNWFGTRIYSLQDGGGAVVDCSAQPDTGDQIVCVLDGEKYLATVASNSGSSMSVSVHVGEDNQNYVISSSPGVVQSVIPLVGYLCDFTGSVWGIVCVLIIPCFLFLVYEIMQLVTTIRHRDDDEEEMVLESPKESRRKLKRELKQERLRYQADQELEQVRESEPMSRTSGSFSTKPFSLNTEDVKDKQDRVLSAKEAQTKFDTIYPPVTKKVDPTRSFTDTIADLKFKMAFQDTHELSKRVDEVIEEDNEELGILQKYGMTTTNIPDGVEIKIDPKKADELTLRLKNDGSLAIVTDNYVANIDMEID